MEPSLPYKITRLKFALERCTAFLQMDKTEKTALVRAVFSVSDWSGRTANKDTKKETIHNGLYNL